MLTALGEIDGVLIGVKVQDGYQDIFVESKNWGTCWSGEWREGSITVWLKMATLILSFPIPGRLVSS